MSENAHLLCTQRRVNTLCEIILSWHSNPHGNHIVAFFHVRKKRTKTSMKQKSKVFISLAQLNSYDFNIDISSFIFKLARALLASDCVCDWVLICMQFLPQFIFIYIFLDIFISRFILYTKENICYSRLFRPKKAKESSTYKQNAAIIFKCLCIKTPSMILT